jgi:hypothetical protein
MLGLTVSKLHSTAPFPGSPVMLQEMDEEVRTKVSGFFLSLFFLPCLGSVSGGDYVPATLLDL